MPARGSSGATTTRLFITSISTTWAASVDRLRHGRGVAALDVEGEIAGRLVPQQRRAAAQAPRRPSTTAIERLVVDAIRSAASRARLDSLSATMKATGSPTWRTRSSASAGRGGTTSGVTAAMQRQRTEAAGGEVGAMIDGMHARQRQRRRRVDAPDPGMGVRRAQHEAVQAVGDGDVVDVAAMPGQEPRILEATQRPPDHRLANAIAHVAPPDKLQPDPRRIVHDRPALLAHPERKEGHHPAGGMRPALQDRPRQHRARRSVQQRLSRDESQPPHAGDGGPRAQGRRQAHRHLRSRAPS